MKDSKYGYVFYIATTICFLFILAYIVTDSPVISPPTEYVYWEDDSSSEQESSLESTLLSSSEVISSKSENKSISKSVSTKSNKSKTSSKTATKHYVSSSLQSSSEVISSEPVSSKEESSETSKEQASEVKNEVSSKTEKPPVDNTSIVNINTASKEQLMSLDGIGDVISQRIIEFRKNIGGFNSIEEIMSVKGIGEKTFEAIKNRLTV